MKIKYLKTLAKMLIYFVIVQVRKLSPLVKALGEQNTALVQQK